MEAPHALFNTFSFINGFIFCWTGGKRLLYHRRVYHNALTETHTKDNTTYGSNANTGSMWNQTTIGNTTFGTDSRGPYGDITRGSNGRTIGTDASGRSF